MAMEFEIIGQKETQPQLCFLDIIPELSNPFDFCSFYHERTSALVKSSETPKQLFIFVFSLQKHHQIRVGTDYPKQVHPGWRIKIHHCSILRGFTLFGNLSFSFTITSYSPQSQGMQIWVQFLFFFSYQQFQSQQLPHILHVHQKGWHQNEKHLLGFQVCAC